MADLTWRFDMTPERVQELQHNLEWALQRQNQRFAKRMRDGHARIQLKLVGGLALVGIGLIVALYAGDPSTVAEHPVLYGACIGVFLAAIIGAIIKSRRRGQAKPESHMRVGAMLSRQAAGVYKQPAARAPYSIDYTLAGDRVRAVAPAMTIDRTFRLTGARLVLHGEHVVFAFRFRWSFHPMRYIYISGEPERAAIVAVLAAANIEHEAITGPVEGYVAPIPGARAL